jgi:ABC-type multidrug transport system fused ATPase/permease subunit
MWQLGWIISLIPDSIFVWITYALIFIGVALYIVSKLVTWLPIISRYKLPAEVGGIIILVIGSYLFGSHGTEMLWRERVKELEAKVAKAEEESKSANSVIQTKIVEKVKTIKVFQDRIKEVIVEKEKIIDAQCKVAPEAIEILNASATNKPLEGKK